MREVAETEHLRNIKIVSVIERSTLHRSSSQNGLLPSKTCSNVFEYCTIDPQTVPKGCCWEKKEPYNRVYHIYTIICKPLVGKCLQCVKESTNQMDKNVAVVLTNSHCKDEVVGHVQRKSSWLSPCFYPCTIVLWTSL